MIKDGNSVMFSQPTPPHSGMADIRARLRPMGIGDILDETFRLYRENFLLFLATAAVLEVPAQIINTLLSLARPAVTTIVPGQGITPAQTSAATTGGLIGVVAGLITAFAGVFITAALAVVVSNRYLGRLTTVGEAYRATLNRLGPLLVTTIWAGIRLVLLGFACVVIIGIPFLIYFAVAWSLLPQVVMLENVDRGASGRSRELIRGYWWKTLGLYIVVAILAYLLVFVILVPVVAGIFAGAGVTGTRLLTGLATLIFSLLVRPIQTVATTLLFYDLKIRKEAFDLETMAQQAGFAAPTRY
jgi:hypothetical protein